MKTRLSQGCWMVRRNPQKDLSQISNKTKLKSCTGRMLLLLQRNKTKWSEVTIKSYKNWNSGPGARLHLCSKCRQKLQCWMFIPKISAAWPYNNMTHCIVFYSYRQMFKPSVDFPPRATFSNIKSVTISSDSNPSFILVPKGFIMSFILLCTPEHLCCAAK